jgi:hypothetical protein
MDFVSFLCFNERVVRQEVFVSFVDVNACGGPPKTFFERLLEIVVEVIKLLESFLYRGRLLKHKRGQGDRYTR